MLSLTPSTHWYIYFKFDTNLAKEKRKLLWTNEIRLTDKLHDHYKVLAEQGCILLKNLRFTTKLMNAY